MRHFVRSSRAAVVLVAALALVGCAGEDPDVLELQAFLQESRPIDEAARLRLNGAFARQAVRAFGGSTQDAPEWSPVTRADAAADVRAWVERRDIDDTGRFVPEADARGARLVARDGVAADRLSRLETALVHLSPALARVTFAEAQPVAITLSGDGAEARVNPRVLELLDARVAAPSVSVAVAAQAAVPAPPKPLSAAKFHETIDTGCVVLDVIVIILTSPIWIFWHTIVAIAELPKKILETCQCSSAGSGALFGWASLLSGIIPLMWVRRRR